MIIIRNNIIPFPGYKCINLCGILFARKKANIDDITINHESIHSKLIFEMLIVFFYIWYILEWFIKVIVYRSFDDAYKNISFEREAHAHENDLNYKHPFYGWFRYLIS